MVATSRRFAKPKSKMRAPPPRSTKTLPGLMSRWTIPRACAWPRPAATSAAVRATAANGSGEEERRTSSVSPSTYSITR
ncbi:MAG: hypothetical protein MUC63_10560 [Planctomycetes bacterium]|nr:hypothetical protein [Planctomycetota bacterium]